MNTKIFQLITKKLKQAFQAPRYAAIQHSIGADTLVDKLAWTPARLRKFTESIEAELQLSLEPRGSVRDIVEDLDRRYLTRFFGTIWRPRTQDYDYSGDALVAAVNAHTPKHVLDVGCGYHPFRGRIPGLVGIDPYNSQADYQVDILDLHMRAREWDAIIALGSINFNSREDIQARFAHCVTLLAPGGRMYMRANPGIQWKNGPWVDIFAWNFAVVSDLAKKYHLELETFKEERVTPARLYFVFVKST